MTYDPDKHHRRSIRLRGYDYALAGAYFVTMVTQDRACLLGKVVAGVMRLNDAGRMVRTVWDELPVYYPGVDIDAVVVMPNHIHGIIVLVGAAPRGRPDIGPDSVFPAANFYGTDRFTYHTYDGVRSSNRTTVTIKVGSINDAPTADAGPAQTVLPGSKVFLSAVNSIDDDGIASLGWKQTSGKRVRLSKSTAQRPSFIAPQVGPEGASLIFQLTVADHLGRRSRDRCIVSVTPVNQPPVAKAGREQKVTQGALVQLNASGSYDQDGTVVSWRWDQIGGPKVQLSSRSLLQPTFTAPQAGTEGAALVFRLTVTDSEGLKAEDLTVVNVVTSNRKPQARARAPKSAHARALGTHDGSGSSLIAGNRPAARRSSFLTQRLGDPPSKRRRLARVGHCSPSGCALPTAADCNPRLPARSKCKATKHAA
jgi:hypothetical protein